MATRTRYLSFMRFGARYGRRVKEKFGTVESESRLKSTCPFCSLSKVKRISSGIWFCSKCDSKFASGAYFVGKSVRGD